MDTTRNMIIALTVVVVLGILYYVYSSYSPSTVTGFMPTSTADVTPDMSEVMTGSTSVDSTVMANPAATVYYDGTSFQPGAVTINQGDTVRFLTDQSGVVMSVASDPHPTHQGYDGTMRTVHCAAEYAGSAPFDECGTGTDYSFTFDQAGTWGYHDHLNPSATGTVIVR